MLILPLDMAEQDWRRGGEKVSALWHLAGAARQVASGKCPVVAATSQQVFCLLFFSAIKMLPALEGCHMSCTQQRSHQSWPTRAGRGEGWRFKVMRLLSSRAGSVTVFKKRRRMMLQVRLGICSKNGYMRIRNLWTSCWICHTTWACHSMQMKHEVHENWMGEGGNIC